VSVVSLDRSGALLVDGHKLFPIVLSNPPPVGGKTPGGGDAFAEIAAGGASFIRAGRPDWSLQSLEEQLAAERDVLDAAAAHGLHCWLQLGNVPDLPERVPAATEQLFTNLVEGLKDHPALGAWKGVDEPANPNRSARVPAARLERAYRKLKELDRAHPVVVTQAPVGTLAQLTPYRPAFDITGADIYPVSYPPGKHAGRGNRDIGVVGTITQKMVKAAGGKPVWMTLQIAWSGVIPSPQHPNNVPRFPTLKQERFMAYQAIVNGARGLSFFGGHLTQIARPADVELGWNWTFWSQVLQPLLAELTSDSLAPALIATAAGRSVKTRTAGVELATRQDANFVYVIAVRRSSGTSEVTFTGLPDRRSGRPMTGGEVLFEYDKGAFRTVRAANGRFRDWLGQHEARVYRFRR
jgi:hypothetical protein